MNPTRESIMRKLAGGRLRSADFSDDELKELYFMKDEGLVEEESLERDTTGELIDQHSSWVLKQ